MDFLSLAKKRYACRKYAPAKVEQEKLDIILEAGRVAPTGANRQPQRLIVVRSQEGMERLARCTRDFGAPCAVIVCAAPGEAWTRHFCDNLLCITGYIRLRLPEHVEPVNILLIGYGIGTPADPDRHDLLRKPLAETVVYETF